MRLSGKTRQLSVFKIGSASTRYARGTVWSSTLAMSALNMRRWSTLETSSYGGRRAMDFGSSRSATATVRCRAAGCGAAPGSPSDGRAVGAPAVQASSIIARTRNTGRLSHFMNCPSAPITVEPGPADYMGPEVDMPSVAGLFSRASREGTMDPQTEFITIPEIVQAAKAKLSSQAWDY